MRDLIARLLMWLGWKQPELQPKPETAAPPDVSGEPTQGIGFTNVYDIHDLLDSLPAYFRALRALRQVDDAAYGVFGRLGGQVAVKKDGSLFNASRLPEGFLENPPAVRCIFFGKDETEGPDGRINASCFYMMRLAGGRSYVDRDGSFVMMPRGLCYRLVIVWMYKGKPIADYCFVHIDDDETIAVVPERRRKRMRLPGGQSFSRAAFGPPQWIATCAKENNATDPSEWLRRIVRISASCKRPDDAILVRASKGGLAGAWTIDKRDAKRFFRKRETGTAADGRRKRILHYVGGFERLVGNVAQMVRAHYRGERTFDWMGYHIEIGGLGFHHADFFDSGIKQYEEQDAPSGDLVSVRTMTRTVADYYRRPVFLTPKRKRAA